MNTFQWLRRSLKSCWHQLNFCSTLSRSAPPTFQPQVEGLEDRLTPASHIWTGVAGNLWSNPNNWMGGAPAANESNVKLVFPAGAANLHNQNDLVNLKVQAITLSGNPYVIDGNPITLGTGGITDSAPPGLDIISLDMILSAGSRSFTETHANTELILDGVLSGPGGLSKAGIGVVDLFGLNTYTGATTVAAGLMEILTNTGLGTGAAGTAVLDGATLSLRGGISVAEPLTLQGAGFMALGALRNAAGSNLCSAPITLQSTATASNSVIDVQAGTLQLKGAIGGSGGLTETGTGILFLTGATPNTYNGTTRVIGGELQLIKSAGAAAVPHSLIIGEGAGVKNSDRVILFQDNQIADGAAVQVRSTGKLDLNDMSDAIGSLKVTDGNVVTGAGALTLNGAITIPDNFLVTIAGKLDLGSGTRTISVGTNSFLFLNAAISGTGGMNKTGTGVCSLQAANSYTGVTTVSGGILRILDDDALGSNTAGTTVLAGATLEVNGSVSGVSEPLTLTGMGIRQLGALSIGNLASGQLFWTGTITLAGAAAFGDFALNSYVFHLNCAIQGAGDLILAGGKESITRHIAFEGTSANTYTGTTRVRAATLFLDKAAGVTAIPHDLVDRFDVELLADDQIADGATVTLNGGELSLNSHNETIHQLLINGSGVLLTGTGTLLVKS